MRTMIRQRASVSVVMVDLRSTHGFCAADGEKDSAAEMAIIDHQVAGPTAYLGDLSTHYKHAA